MGTRAVGASMPSAIRAIRRPRLDALLDDCAQRRLTTVVAPAGYGKTAALTDWASSHADPVAWLALRPVHNRLRRVAGDLARSLEALERAPSAILVLDDFHNLTDEDALEHCAAVIEHLPESVHVVLASRADPPRRCLHLRLSDELAEMRYTDLAFTLEEAAELLPPADVDAAMGRTMGWALGLNLSDDARVDEFLTAEILAIQSDDLGRFLLSTSVLDGMSG